MTLDLGRYGTREILNLQVFDYVSKNPLMYFDYANTATFETGSTRVHAWGAGSRRLSWDGEKQLTLTVETQIFSMEHLAMLSGEEIISGAKDIYKVETVAVGAGGAIALKNSPIGGVDGVAVFPFIRGVIDKQAPQPIESVTSNTVTLATGAAVAEGDEVQVFYQFSSASAHTISFTAKGFPQYVKLVGDTLYMDEVAGTAVDAQMVFYKAKVQPNVTIGMSSQGDPTSISLVFDLYPVQVNGTDTIADITVFE
ncbi:hypothetical protein M6D81_15340 [Paenibacillus sp. J5C_2022]|uniref:hypothetical protein n=1 Tax=Paenibacillus sp. J5C2022 TaxID=2977129 RepID=UPI0021CF2A12|nr:hypothetical protein [Paenibacillus sp. J5C2022]MCU6710070.1 hypothetical protein [Paenibacillus sp. J5C2022]